MNEIILNSKVRDEINSIFEQMNSRFDHVDANLEEMKGSLNNLFYLFALKEGFYMSENQKNFLKMSIKQQINKNYSEYVTNYQNFNDIRKK